MEGPSSLLRIHILVFTTAHFAFNDVVDNTEITELDDGIPGTIIFYDRGVFLTVQDSPVLEDLKALEGRGVTLLACGTCLKHFNILEEHAVGLVSNMYETALELGTAERFYSI